MQPGDETTASFPGDPATESSGGHEGAAGGAEDGADKAAGENVQPEDGSTWLIMELCNRGSLQVLSFAFFCPSSHSAVQDNSQLLRFSHGKVTQRPQHDTDACAADLLAQDSIDRGMFLRRQGDPASGPRLSAVLSVALDVATGMAYLHERGIIHGGDGCPA